MSRRGILIVNINPSARTLAGCREIARAVEAMRPELPAPIRHWRRLDASTLRRLRPRGVIVGPNDTPFPAYPPAFDELLAWLRRRRGPTLGICGGHQAIALAHGAPVGPVHDVPAARASYEGMPRVREETRIRFLGDPDPLVDGLPGEITVPASHVDEVKELPPRFRLLAVGDAAHIQVVRAERRPVWGVQGHVERAPTEAPARRLLAHWLDRVAAPAASAATSSTGRPEGSRR